MAKKSLILVKSGAATVGRLVKRWFLVEIASNDGNGVSKKGSPLKGLKDESKGTTIFPLPFTKFPADKIVLFCPILTFPSTTLPNSFVRTKRTNEPSKIDLIIIIFYNSNGSIRLKWKIEDFKYQYSMMFIKIHYKIIRINM